MKPLETPQLNVPLLREIQAAITAEPMQHSMHSWISEDDISPCGTTFCIAGLACILATAKIDPKPIGKIAVNLYMTEAESSFERNACSLLGITSYQGLRLFHVSSWPEPFRGQYSDLNFLLTDEEIALNRPASAKITVARIDHFITTNGKE